MYSVCVIVPSWHYWANPFKLQPLWEMYYATVIESAFPSDQVKVSIEDTRGSKGSLEDVSNKVPEHDMYLFWIMKSGDAIEVQSLVSNLRKRFPKAKFVAGGTHVDMCTEECAKYFDAVIVGPGEVSLKEIISSYLKGNPAQKLNKMDYNLVHFNQYPFPRRSLLPKESIINNVLFEKYGGISGTSVQFSRGCVFRCAYCVYNVPNLMQTKTPEQMENEINYLKKEYGIKGINLRDEICIPVNPKVSGSFLQAIGNTNVKWRGQTTVKASEELLKLAADTGCVELSVGVETVSELVMSIIDKKWQTLDDVRKFLSNAKKYGIKVKMCLIFGLPGEPLDIVEKTSRFLDETKPDFVSLSGFCPVPGSPMFKNPEKYGIKYIDHDWSKHAHLLYRFSDEEEVGLPFEFEKETPWGPSFTKEQIVKNIQELQRNLEEKGMVY